MKKFPKRRDINIEDYTVESTDKTKFGLPSDIKFCSKCIISNQRPNSAVEFEHTKDTKKNTINFNANDVCDACLVKESKTDTIDWDAREKELIDLCNKHRSKDGSYDCLVPGSGGKDSFYQSHILTKELPVFLEKSKVIFLINQEEIMDLDMIQFLFR